jgi:hypothetical protein
MGGEAARRETAVPVANEPKAAEAGLKAALETLKASQAAGQIGTLKGIGMLALPPAPPVALEKRAVSLIPSTPDLEAALGTIARKWRQGRRRPVAVGELQEAFALLDRHVRAVRAAGAATFLRFAETDDKGRFAFEAIPAGRWLLVTSLESPVSALLWAIPRDIIAGDSLQVTVGPGSILLEGRTSPGDEPATQ